MAEKELGKKKFKVRMVISLGERAVVAVYPYTPKWVTPKDCFSVLFTEAEANLVASWLKNPS